MKLVTHKPAARGVSQLMYVGDEPADTPGIPLVAKLAAVAAVIWVLCRR